VSHSEVVCQLDCSLGSFELGWIGNTKSCLREIGGEESGCVWNERTESSAVGFWKWW